MLHHDFSEQFHNPKITCPGEFLFLNLEFGCIFHHWCCYQWRFWISKKRRRHEASSVAAFGDFQKAAFPLLCKLKASHSKASFPMVWIVCLASLDLSLCWPLQESIIFFLLPPVFYISFQVSIEAMKDKALCLSLY